MIQPSYQNDEGITTTDNDTNNNNKHNRPQHLQAQPPQYQHTPHGAMTSILSAANYSPMNYDNNSRKQQQNGVSKEKGIKTQTNNNSKDESNTKKALRMRASKYFHRSPTPPINNKSSNSKNMVRQNSPQSDATTALATTSTTTTTNTQQVHISPTVTPDNNNTSSKQSIFTNNNALQRPPKPNNIPRPEPHTNIQTVQVEAKLTSANIQQLQQQSTTTNSNYNTSDCINSDPSLELYPSASNSNANGYSNSNINGYDSDIQSNATSGYNSGSDLENAARRIMRGKGKRKLPKVPVQLNLDNEGLNGEEGKGISDGNLSDIGNVSDIDTDLKQDSSRATKNKKKGLPTGWRERIQRKTGIELPTMNTTSPSRKRNAAVATTTAARVEEEKSAADYALSTILNQHRQQGGVRDSLRDESYSYEEEEGNDQIQPLPNYRNMSSTTIDYSDDYARGHQSIHSGHNQNQYNGDVVYQNDNEQFALMNDIQQQQQHNVPYGQYNQQYQHNRQFVQGQQQHRQHDQEYYTEDLVNNGAFPNYAYGRGQPQSGKIICNSSN